MVGKTITIARQESGAIESGMRVELTRREMLRGTGILIGTLALSSTLAMVTPSRVWAAELQRLSTHQGAVLLALSKQIFPHSNLDDAVYALLVKALDGKAQKDATVRRQLVDGIRELDRRAPGTDWTKQPAQAQIQDVDAISKSPFFETVRGTGIVALYSNTLAYKHFGYRASEGDGGYLFNGFNDLAWLPNPPEQDSGPIPAQ
ncbi:hypothetical protein [Pandoraea sp. SD6-2]|uniref:hypothetical protein n=1 Tax=Pandoraea sp. SD6-2 TaxID=1286093 RepID=UPI00032F005F|nr:hypothetical protein [Pandoraea sp. SD6-2]EON12794.1 hypothetical protein C266_15492 [Pandoraea sp. SD6-2]